MTGTAMSQVLQHLRSGKTEVAGVPVPTVRPGHLLIRTRVSLISAGTERMLLEFGQAGWLEKARQQPDKVRQVLDKIRTDGLVPAIEAVLNRLDQPLPLGYCNAGEVIAVGESVAGFAVGDRVASNRQHAEVVCVPKHMCARVPEGVSDETAAFTVPGAIALPGLRLAQPTLGESVAVIGLGLIGLLNVQLLRAQGCRGWIWIRRGAETVTLQLGFTDGSIGTIHYFANGAPRFPKERVEVFCAGRVLRLDNFRWVRLLFVDSPIGDGCGEQTTSWPVEAPQWQAMGQRSP